MNVFSEVFVSLWLFVCLVGFVYSLKFYSWARNRTSLQKNFVRTGMLLFYVYCQKIQSDFREENTDLELTFSITMSLKDLKLFLIVSMFFTCHVKILLSCIFSIKIDYRNLFKAKFSLPLISILKAKTLIFKQGHIFVCKRMKILTICLGDEGSYNQDLWRELLALPGFFSMPDIPL